MKTIQLKASSDIAIVKESLNKSGIHCGCVAALGFFDGVHAAHRALINEAKATADKLNLPLAIFTFSEQSASFKPDAERLFTDSERLRIFEQLGVDFTVISDFSAVKNLTAEKFVSDILIAAMGVRVAVCGYNFRFGKNASAGVEELSAFMKKEGASAIVINEYLCDGTRVSSSEIRSLLKDKQILKAAKLLGQPYFMTGEVSHGLALGRKMGIPTVNVPLQEGRFKLPLGVYLTVCMIKGRAVFGLTNVGSCPTFGSREIHSETFLLDFSEEIYAEEIKIYFLHYIREEKKFSNAEELILQINVDKNKAIKLAGEIKWQEIGLNLQ